MVLYLREAIPGTNGGIPPGVLKVKRAAVVDQPELLVPDEHVGIARGPIRVGDIGVEPDDGRSQIRIGRWCDEWIEGNGAGKVIEGQIESGALLDQLLDLEVRLRAPQHRIELDEHDLRHG